jgi:ankyrin repeat protein
MSYFKSLKQLLNMFILTHQSKTLSKAIARADLPSIKYLPSDLQRRDKIGNTLLHYAVLSNNVEVVRVLLESSPDLEIKNSFGQTPLMLACEVCSTKKPYYQIFITPEDDNQRRKQTCFEIVQLLVESGASIQTQDKNNTTPIIKASLKENELIVKYLLEHSGNIYQKDNKNGTAAAYALECQNNQLIKILLEPMDNYKFSEFVAYIKTISSIVTKNMIDEIVSMKDILDSEKRKNSLDQMLAVKPGRISNSRQVKI